MAEIKEDAKVCPWCGSEAEVYQQEGRWIVRCTSNGECPVMPYSWTFATKEKAIAAWNTRLGEQNE